MSERIAPGGLTALIAGKKPTIAVELPDGRILDVEADSPEAAGQAAKAFMNNEAAQARVESERGLIQNVDDRVRAFARGVPVLGGATDEIAAALNTLDIPVDPGGAMALARGGKSSPWQSRVATSEKMKGFLAAQNDAYEQELAYQRARDVDYDDRHPAESAVVQIGGGIAGTIAGLRLLPNGVRATVPLSRTHKYVAGTGAGLGGGYTEGFMRGEGGIEARNDEATKSALWGAGAGAVSPAISKVVGATYNSVASWLANRGVDAKSISVLLDRLKAQGVTPQQVQARIAELGDEAMLADVTPGMQAFAAGTAIADNGAGNIIGTRLATRRESSGIRGEKILDDAFGPPQNPYNGPANLNADSDNVYPIRTQLDMMIESARRTGNSELAAKLDTIRNGGDVRPKGEADTWYSSPYRNQRAYEKGRTKVLTNEVSSAEHAADVANYTSEELAMSNAGLRYELGRRLSNAQNSPGIATERILARDNNLDKVQSSIGAAKTRNLQRGIDSEETFNDTSNLAEPARQRNAAAIGAARDFWGKNVKPGALADMIAAGGVTAATTGSWKAGATAAVNAGAGRLRQVVSTALTPSASPALIKKTAENLTAQGVDLRTIAGMLVERAQELPKRSEAVKNIEKMVRLLLTTQAGRAGFEGQRLISGGPR